MTLNMENDDVREYIAQITLAERYAAQIEAIRRVVLDEPYESNVRSDILMILGLKREVKND